MSFDPYIHFPGTAEAAMRHYHDVLGGDLQIMYYREAPPEDGAEPGDMQADPDRVMHACLTLKGRMLMASDYPLPEQDQPQTAVSISHGCDSRAEAERIFSRLCDEGSQILMPFGDAFWSDGFGMGTDRFGTTWMVGGPSTM